MVFQFLYADLFEKAGLNLYIWFLLFLSKNQTTTKKNQNKNHNSLLEQDKQMLNM